MNDAAAPSAARVLLTDVLWGVTTWLGLTILTACMTVLFLAMRALLDIGGVCAVGGPFEIAQECPPGVGLAIPMSILTGFVGAGLFFAGSVQLGGPRLWLLAWSALFLSLGWNFFEFGVLRTYEAGTDWTFALCAVLFGVMGVVPLCLQLGLPAGRREALWSDSMKGAARRQPLTAARHGSISSPVQSVTAAAVPAGAGARRPDPSPPHVSPPHVSQPDVPQPDVPLPDPPPSDTGQLVGELERLARLHERGALSDHEFRTAKDRLLDGRPQ